MSVPQHRKRLPSADRRQQILDAGVRLFVERGYEAVTMGDLAAALGISRPTIYSYFTSTEAVLDELLAERLQGLLGRLEPLLCAPTPDQRGGGWIDIVFRFLLKERETLALLHSGGGPTFRARRHAFLDDLGARLQLDPNLPVRRDPALLLILTTLLDSLAFRAVSDPDVDTDQLLRSLEAFVRGGLHSSQEDA